MDAPKLKATSLELKESTIRGVKAFGTIVFNDMLEINSLKIIEGKKGLFVSWPSRESNGKWYNYIFFSDSDIKDKLDKWIIKQFEDGNVTPATPKAYPKVAEKATPSKKVVEEDDDDSMPF